ncbi:MAG: TolC family protein, partial [Leptospiraceae bacterium]|nr:TolC family protein [Leptospiraceae bacterium]
MYFSSRKAGSHTLKFSLFVVFLLICSFGIASEDLSIAEKIWKLSQNDEISQSQKKTPSNGQKVIRLTIQDAVKYVIENNITVKNAKYEIIKADSDLIKNDSKFLWKVLGTVESFRSTLPNNRLNVFTGTKISNDKFSAGIEKQFATGTYFKLEASAVRFDSNAFESSSTPADFKFMAVPPMYTGAVSFTLSQELLKSSFGKTEKNQVKILENQTAMKREELIYQLSGLIVQVLVDYWSLTIYDSAVQTYEKLLKNTIEIRDLTRRKQNLGLAEKFEINQWNSALAGVKSQLEKTKQDREETKIKLLRILNVDPTSEVTGLTDLTENAVALKKTISEDIDYAYQNRIDLRNVIREKEISELSLTNAEKEDIPSLKVSATYSSRGQNLISPQENYLNTEHAILSMKYPEYRGDV